MGQSLVALWNGHRALTEMLSDCPHLQAIIWKAVMKPRTIYVQAGDTIYFKFADTLLHDIVLLKNKAAYDSCFGNGEDDIVEEPYEDVGPGLTPLGPWPKGTYYYACHVKGHCADRPGRLLWLSVKGYT